MKSFIFFLALSLFGVNISNAQIVDRTENRAKQKANQRVDQKIDNGLDKGLDAIEGLFGKKKKNDSKVTDSSDEAINETGSETQGSSENNAAQSEMMSKLFGGGNVNIQDSYSFDHNILMNIQTFDKKGKPGDVQKMTMYFSDETPHFGMSVDVEGSDNFIIYDMKTYEMVTLMNSDGTKMGMAIKLDPEKFTDDEDVDNTNKNISFEKTGKTKTISGYNCEEYKLNDPDAEPGTTTFFWMTEDIDTNWIEMMSKIASSNKNMQKNFVLPEDYPKGSMIQVINASDKNDEKTVTTVEAINKNQHKEIETKGYQMMSLPGGSN